MGLPRGGSAPLLRHPHFKLKGAATAYPTRETRWTPGGTGFLPTVPQLHPFAVLDDQRKNDAKIKLQRGYDGPPGRVQLRLLHPPYDITPTSSRVPTRHTLPGRLGGLPGVLAFCQQYLSYTRCWLSMEVQFGGAGHPNLVATCFSTVGIPLICTVGAPFWA